MARETILVVEDEQDILELITFNLEANGYTVLQASSGEKGLEVANKKKPDLIILDLMLPGIDGLEVCKKIKRVEDTAEIPIIMVTAKSEDSDIITGLELGADDYITKPFSTKVLIARVRTSLRRERVKEAPKSTIRISIHDITIDTSRYEVLCSETPVNLSATEFAILHYLAKNPGWVFSRNQIIDAVKGDNYPVTERSVDVQILGLRKKLGDQGQYIETVRGVGYRLRNEQ